MTIKNTTEANTSVTVNTTANKVKLVATSTQEKETKKPAKAVAAYHANTRYSLNGNGYGYRGL